MDQYKKNEFDYFNIDVAVIEAKDLPSTNISSFVRVQVGEEHRITKVIKNTNRPYFDEYFVFEMYSTFEDLMNTIIIMSIFRPRKKCRCKRLIGCLKFDVGIIWAQPNERLQTWIPLSLPSDYSAKVKGRLRCNIKIESSDTYKKQSGIEDLGIENYFAGKRIRLRIKVYKCVGLKYDKKMDAPDVLVKVLFAGFVGTTTVRQLRECVEWNEQVTFVATFPPLFHKLTIQLVIGKSTISKHFYILESLKFLSGGYQFGPNYVHLYRNEFLYSGSLLVSIETDRSGVFHESERLHKITTTPFEKVTKKVLGNTEKVLCFGVVFDVMLSGRKWKDSDVQVALDFGYSEYDDKDLIKDHPLTDRLKPIPGNSDFSYLPLEDRKPCVFVRSPWPDTTHRLQNSNILSNIAQILREAIDLAEVFIAKGKTSQAKEIIKKSMIDFEKACQETSKMFMQGVNGHDLGRIKFLSHVLSLKLPQLASSCLAESNMEVILKKSISLLSVVDNLVEDIQESLPCVIISVKTESTVIGSGKISPRNILFSKKPRRRGCDCGKIVKILMKSPNNTIAGRIDIWLWLGFWDEVSYCLKELPPGHEDLSKIVSLPTFIKYENLERYIVYCRIYSGYLVDPSGFDGPCDTFVRVLCLTHGQQTKTVKKSMAPIWKETLVLTGITLYPSHTFTQTDPPSLTVELWNQATNPPRLVGAELVKPTYIDQKIESDYGLQWIKIKNKAKILSAFLIARIDTDPGKPFDVNALTPTDPKVVDPVTIPFRLEVVFWGIRPVDISGLGKNIARVQAVIQCSTSELESNIISRTLTSMNFIHDLHTLPVQLPSVQFFSPPLILQIISDNVYVGCNLETNVHRYAYKLPTKMEWEALCIQRKSLIANAECRRVSIQDMPDLIPLMEIEPLERGQLFSEEVPNTGRSFKPRLENAIDRFKRKFLSRTKQYEKYPAPTNIQSIIEEEKEQNWWSGYFSGEIKIYTDELENQIEFNGFNDVLETYVIRGREKGRLRDIMKIKTIMGLYEWPSEKNIVTFQGQDPETGVIKVTELRDRVKLLVRVYCVRAHNLDPKDPNGLADPYVEIATPSNCVSDKIHHISKQLNPTFGRCLEIPATLPTDSILTVRVIDWDRFTPSDPIGETVIDIENRFYSRHRGTCGLPGMYVTTGDKAWRDVEKPTEILEKLCNSYNLPLPRYFERSVLIGSKEFVNMNPLRDPKDRNERLALLALNRWSEMPIVGRVLVPQHVETRTLYLKDKPGISRGKLELWVDLFDQSLGEIPPRVNIKPCKPEMYELRIIILNTAKIPLVDDSYLVGKKSTDIYVKGWLWDPYEAQSTDVHYLSINGSGAFNWRFVFQFLYLKLEKRMVVYKTDLFTIGPSENKVPALLNLQVWDSDSLTADDFIGAMVFELYKMPRGSRSVKACKPSRYLNPDPSQIVDLFKVKRLRGWWPFFEMSTEIEPKDTGFLEAEFHLLTKEEALHNPAGLGRDPPNALKPPFRPSIKIKFWMAPFRAVFYLFCWPYKGKILSCLCIFAFVIFLLVGIYSLPFFITKRLTGA